MIGKGVQAWARTPLIILAGSFPSMFAGGTDTLGFGVELWSSEWKQASPRGASVRVSLIEMLRNVREGVG